MSDMAVGHEIAARLPTAVTPPALATAAIHRHHFAQHAIGADLEPAFGEIVATDLAFAAQDRAGVHNRRERPIARHARHHHMGKKLDAIIQRDPGAEMAKGADFDIRAQTRAVFNQGCWMDSSLTFRAGMDRGAEFGLGAQRIANIGMPFETPHRPAAAQRFHRHAQQHARMDGLAKPRLFDRHEIDDVLLALQAQTCASRPRRPSVPLLPRSARPASPHIRENDPEKRVR